MKPDTLNSLKLLAIPSTPESFFVAEVVERRQDLFSQKAGWFLSLRHRLTYEALWGHCLFRLSYLFVALRHSCDYPRQESSSPKCAKWGPSSC